MDTETLTTTTRPRIAGLLMALGLALAGCSGTGSGTSASPAGQRTPAGAVPSSAASSTRPAMTECPSLVLQWATTVFTDPHLLTLSNPPTNTADILPCITDTADYRVVAGRGSAQLGFARPDPTKVPAGSTLAGEARQQATTMLNLPCVNAQHTTTTIGAVTEQSCTLDTTEPGVTAVYAVSNDHAAGGAVISYTSKTSINPATRAYLTALARTAAYAALGTL